MYFVLVWIDTFDGCKDFNSMRGGGHYAFKQFLGMLLAKLVSRSKTIISNLLTLNNIFMTSGFKIAKILLTACQIKSRKYKNGK